MQLACAYTYTSEFANTHTCVPFESLESGHAWTDQLLVTVLYKRNTRGSNRKVNYVMHDISQIRSIHKILVQMSFVGTQMKRVPIADQ